MRWAGSSRIPFLKDADVHVRFLVALPLLVVAELVVHRRLRFVVGQFRERELVPASALQRFDAALAELLLVAFVYLVGVSLIWRNYTALAAATWYAEPTSTGLDLTLCGSGGSAEAAARHPVLGSRIRSP